MAASFARFGYKSIVVEGEPSQLNKGSLPFELISIPDTNSSGLTTQPSLEKEEVLSVLTKGRSLAAIRIKMLSPLFHSLPQRLKESLENEMAMGNFIRDFKSSHFYLPLKYLPPASLYYLHSPLDFPAIQHVCKKFGVPFIYDAHDFYSGINEQDHPSSFEKGWARPFRFKLESKCINEANAVVTVCDGVAQLQSETFRCHPVVIRNCHDVRLDYAPHTSLRHLLGLTHDDFLVVTVGTAKNGMAIEQALQAMSRLPKHVHLAFVGRETETYVRAIQSKGMMAQVHALPPVMPFEVVPFIQSADASAIFYYARSPSYENCLPNGFFQPIAAELPLLYPELPEIEKIAKKYDLGIPIDPLNPESITAAIVHLMANRDLSSQYRMNARAAKQEMSWEREEIVLRNLVAQTLTETVK